jgi:hypothetical protein
MDTRISEMTEAELEFERVALDDTLKQGQGTVKTANRLVEIRAALRTIFKAKYDR